MKTECIERAGAMSQRLRERNTSTWDDIDREAVFAIDALVAYAAYLEAQKQPPVIDKSVATRIASQLGWEKPRKPLTDEELFKLWVSVPAETEDRFAFARAIEAAHDIGGEA